MAHEGGNRQPIVDPAAVVSTGLASAAAAFLTSRFGIAGTVLGTAVAVMIMTAASSVLEAWLRSARDRFHRPLAPLRGRGEAPGRRGGLSAALVTALAAFALGMGLVTGVELGAGKSLSCWVWDRCPAEQDGERASGETATRPTMLGGGPATAPLEGPYSLSGQGRETTRVEGPGALPGLSGEDARQTARQSGGAGAPAAGPGAEVTVLDPAPPARGSEGLIGGPNAPLPRGQEPAPIESPSAIPPEGAENSAPSGAAQGRLSAGTMSGVLPGRGPYGP